MDHPRPGLKYVPLDELDRSKMTFDNFNVNDQAGDKLGRLEGFIIDVNEARPYYVVVDAAGWFRSKHLLLPIGHVTLDLDSRVLIGDVPKERVNRFPGFDLDLFPELTEAELDRLGDEIGSACCPDELTKPTGSVGSGAEGRAHYGTPTWWTGDFYRPERYDDGTGSAGTH